MKSRFFSLAALLIFTFISCNSNPDTAITETPKNDSSASKSKEVRNREAAEASLKALADGNTVGVLKDAAQDVTDYGDGSGNSVKGIDSIRSGMQMWLSNVKYDKYDHIATVAEGDDVFIYAKWTGKFTKDYMGMKTAGKSFTVSDVDMFKFNAAGKVVEHRSVQPFSTVMNQVLPKSK